MQVFWLKGYSNTTIQDVVEATGIKSGSLYAAFGDKERLFRNVFEHYTCYFNSTLPQNLPPLAAIRAWLDVLVEVSTSDPLKRGCLIVNATLERPAHSAETLRLVQARLDEIQDFFRVNLHQAQTDGDLPNELDVEQTSAILLGKVVSIMVLARFGANAEIVRAQADLANILPVARSTVLA